MQTLICLLSMQLIPNLISCKVLHPERIVLVETFKMRKLGVAKNFQDALNKMRIGVEATVVTIPEGMDNDFPSLMAFFDENLRQKYPEDHFFLNLTGATKPMSIALYETFQNHAHANFYYFDVDHPCDIIDFLKNESHYVGQIPLEVFLAGYGFQTAKKANDIYIAELKARERKALTMFLAQKCNTSKFRIWGPNSRDWVDNAINKHKSSKSRKPKVFKLEPGILCPCTREIAKLIAEQFKLELNEDGCLLGSLTNFDVKYLDGGWLEEFIWLVLDEFDEKYQLKDLHLGQMIQKAGSDTQNELDVSFMRNNTLYVLECKTGFQEKIADFVYKLYAVTKQLQAIGTRMFLISNSPNINRDTTKERARLHFITLVDAEQIHQLTVNPEEVLNKFFNI